MARRIALALIALLAVPLVAASPADAQLQPVTWAALGDSYSAGVGLGAATAGCDRDNGAYAPRAGSLLLSAYPTTFSFLACTGATTGSVQSTQVPPLTSAVTLATLTVGGNDIGFADRLVTCFLGPCGAGTISLTADTAAGAQSWDEVTADLVATYTAVRAKMAASGHLFVLTYPMPFARQSSADCAGFTALEQNAANALVTRLDDTIVRAVQLANAKLAAVPGRPGNVHIVEWRTGLRVPGGYRIPSGYVGAGRTFDTYATADGLCNTSKRVPFINSWILTADAQNSFHPNATGYLHAARQLGGAVGAIYRDSTPRVLGNTLASAATMSIGDSLRSADGRLRLVLQRDGNLVLSGPSGALWSTRTAGRGTIRAVMQSDGNLVLFDGRGTAVWSSHTNGHAGARLVVQNDGNLVIYRSSTAVWWTA